jgi:hypothetical protein
MFRISQDPSSGSNKTVKLKLSRYRLGVAQMVGTGIALFVHDRGIRSG